MILKKLSIKNIRSYESLDLEFKKGSTLLSGNIGSGKTSILLAIQFALFGLQPGQKGSSILRFGETNAYAKVEIEIDNKTISIERTIKKNKNNSISQDKNIITIEDERKELSTSEIKNRVIDILNYPKEFAKKSNLLYKFTIYTPQEEMKNIIEERPEIRLDTIRHIFGIDRYKRIKENTNILLQKIKESIRIKEVLISELNLLKEKLKVQTEKKISQVREINNLKEEYNQIKQKTAGLEKEKKELEEKLEKKRKTDAEIKNKKAIITGKVELENRLKKEMATMQKEIKKEIDFSYERLKAAEEILRKHKEMIEEKNKEYMKINNQASVLESKKEGPASLREKVMSIENCPTCFQEVSRSHKEKISKKTGYEIQEIDFELKAKLEEKNRIIKEIEKEKELIKGYEKDFYTLQENKHKFEYNQNIKTKMKSDAYILDRTSTEIQELRKETEELKKSITEDFEEEYKRVTKEFNETTSRQREREIELATKNKELELSKKTLEETEEEIGKKEKTKEQLVYLRNLQEWLQQKFIMMITTTEKNVLSKIRNEFSEIFSQWFNTLVTPELTVRLNEDFTPIISNQDYEMDYDFLSGGERTAIALSYRLALNQVLNSLLSRIKTKELVILDEPTDGFSSEQIDKMRDLFTQLKSEQLILVSHEQKIEGFVDHVIKVSKDHSSDTEKIMN